jgi:quinol monooxygenase YgiN
MVIVAGTLTVDPSQREALLASRMDAMRATRKEPGCLEYTFSADPTDPLRCRGACRYSSTPRPAITRRVSIPTNGRR